MEWDHPWNSEEPPPSDRNAGISGNPGGVQTTQDYLEFCECVLAGAAGFYQLEWDLFVVQAWDSSRSVVRQAGVWYHLQRFSSSDYNTTICFCPQYKLLERCVHVQFLQEYGVQQFSDDFPLAGSSLSPCLSVFGAGRGLIVVVTTARHRSIIIFSFEETHDVFSHSFSVSGDSVRDSVKARVIVHHNGKLGSEGAWTCSKDSRGKCGHIKRAKDYLAKLSRTEGAEDEDEGQAPLTEDTGIELASSPRGRPCISHCPILPPRWASLPDDEILYPRPLPLRTPPTIISLDSGARCICGATPRIEAETLRRRCTVYSIFESWTCEIEVQACHQACSGSRGRYIGPDGHTMGLFNYNNDILLTHDLLDDYTLAFTSSETPFTAWVSVVSRRYQTFTPNSSFVNEDLFRTAWFEYVKVQNFGKDMECPTCGPEPKSVIFDGVTLAFGKKYLTDSLEPPTVINEKSETRTCKYVYSQATIKNKDLRLALRKVVTGRSLTTVAGDEDEEDDFESGPGPAMSKEKMVLSVLARIESIPMARTGLELVCPALSRLFSHYFGIDRIESGIKPHRDLVEFFREISSEASIIQIIPLPSLKALKGFIVNPCTLTARALICIPALYRVLPHEELYDRVSGKALGKFNDDVIEVFAWLGQRATDVLNELRTHAAPGILVDHVEEEDSWIKTGRLYNMPKIRQRPRYANLKYDQKIDGGKKRAKCSKYYAQYGKNRLTGGIMVAWCTHSIAYGFHCIPMGEGRNDVFSALVAYWREPPEWVIYDYACALGPYCMTREADFFKNTKFAIDDCHSLGHSKCSQACFLKTYADLDPRLAKINTSAAECGNGAIGRIRKSVSYMRQDRAIIYTRVFVAVWNRLKIRKMLGIQ
ncbi:hypothetical protein CPC08DRAFT_647429 [Agrocybe pediades]|nr:hypothetical protein CPC08DRAFT_647429 [Agrocybe pediades]